ncbi:MAG: prepilin-type N-terminal cleavage/methylation domain-containing protein [Planctomycetota bacterium]
MKAGFELRQQNCSKRRCSKRRGRRRGFTLVELLVVMGIISMSAAMMAPAITTYFRNKDVDNVKGEFTSVMRRARLRAVTEGRDFSVVFFKEGARVYDELNFVFGGDWSPDDSRLGAADSGLMYVLGCAGKIPSNDKRYVEEENFVPKAPFIPPFKWWEDKQNKAKAAVKEKGGKVIDAQFDIRGLVKITFHRDGTLDFGPGASDVRSVLFRKEDTDIADIICYQLGNRASAYLDISRTGLSKSKIVVRPFETYIDGKSGEYMPGRKVLE